MLGVNREAKSKSQKRDGRPSEDRSLQMTQGRIILEKMSEDFANNAEP